MKSYLKYLLACLGLLLLLPACKNESDVEEATIDVSTQLMTFTKDGANRHSPSRRTRTRGLPSPLRSLGSLTQEGNALKVKASANDRGVDRSASIIVNAGGAQRRVAVTQSAADGLYRDDGYLRALPQGWCHEEGHLLEQWRCRQGRAGYPSRLAHHRPRADGSIVLTAKESAEKYRRRVKVLLTVGTTLTEIEAIQEGSVQYVLPILKFPASLATVMSEEMARGNALIQLPDGSSIRPLTAWLRAVKRCPSSSNEFTDPQRSWLQVCYVYLCRQHARQGQS